MKVQITRPTIAKKRGAMPGDILEVSQEEGIQLISAGKAVALKESAVETTEAPIANEVPDLLVEKTELPAANTQTFAPTIKNKKKKASE